MLDQVTQLVIRSGGQTGVDRAALDAAMDVGVSVRGWCPAGRLAEDGPVDAKYPLIETESAKYSIRTEWNVRDADATLIISPLPLEGGTLLTEQYAIKHRKPCFVVDSRSSMALGRIRDWLAELGVADLNVAGPRESKQPGIYALSYQFVASLLQPATIETSSA